MKKSVFSQSCHRICGWLIFCASVFVAATVTWVPDARAQRADDAAQILKSMSDYVAGQKNISLIYDSDVEVITSEVEKIQFTASFFEIFVSLCGFQELRLQQGCKIGIRGLTK